MVMAFNSQCVGASSGFATIQTTGYAERSVIAARLSIP